MMRSALLAALISAVLPTMAFAQTADDLKNDEKTPGDVLVYGMGYSGNRYSPLTQINKENVKKLVPKWAYLARRQSQGGESFPLVKDGVIYITIARRDGGRRRDDRQADLAGQSRISAGDLARRLLRHRQSRRRDLQGQDHSRALDNRIMALDAKTGKEVWKVKSPEPVDIRQRLCNDRRADRRQRRRDRRRGRRRVQPSRLRSKATMPRPASISGGSIPFRPRANPAPRPGKAIPRSPAAAAAG